MPSSGVSITIEGLDELKKKFAQLSDKQQRGVLRTAIRAGANLVVREARKRAPVRERAQARVARRALRPDQAAERGRRAGAARGCPVGSPMPSWA